MSRANGAVPATDPVAGADAVVEVAGVSKAFGGVKALSDVDLQIRRDRITALIGPNGAGKTTLVNVVTGIYRADAGVVRFHGRDIGHLRSGARSRAGLVRTFQKVRLFPQLTVLENALALHWARRVWRSDRAARSAAMERLEQFGLARDAARSPEELTFADRRRLEIVRCLIGRPEVMMLDEPAAGMNPEEARAFVEQIAALQRDDALTVLLIEHNMKVVMGLAHTIYVLDFGQVIASGTPQEIRSDPAVIAAYLGAGA